MGVAVTVIALGLGHYIKLVAMLTAFCDETGTHAAAPLTCVGGYLFDEESQKTFSEEWAEKLKPYRSRGVKFFHSSPCDAGDGPFANLSKAERDAMFGDLIALTRATAKCAAVAGIEESIYRGCSERLLAQSYTGTKYTACVLQFLYMIGDWATEQKIEDKIFYIFADGEEAQDEVDSMMKQIENMPDLSNRFHYGGHQFSKQATVLPLQAADLWAWIWQKCWARKEWTPYAKALLKRPGHIPHLANNMSDISLSIHAMVNMDKGLKSNREYPKQTGKVRKYTV